MAFDLQVPHCHEEHPLNCNKSPCMAHISSVCQVGPFDTMTILASSHEGQLQRLVWLSATLFFCLIALCTRKRKEEISLVKNVRAFIFMFLSQREYKVMYGVNCRLGM